MSKIRLYIAGMAITGFMILTGCMTTTVDASSARAQTGPTESTAVDIVSVPYDANYPTYVIAVERLGYNASGTVSGGNEVNEWFATNRQNIGPGLSAQLMTALSRCGNISILEIDGLAKNSDGTYSTKLGPNEIGPFIVRGTVTEFIETADANNSQAGGSLGRLGAAMGLAGAVTGKGGLTWTGAGLAAANPTMKKGKMKRSGAVGLDLRLVDGRNNRLVGAFNCSGSFTTVSAESGFSLFGIGKSGSAYAASALGQATRAAMNDAVQQSNTILKNKAR